jgi:glucosamine--fructose-6-phosphate aminotransferase (isomerizing)
MVIEPSVMLGQVDALAADLAARVAPTDALAREAAARRPWASVEQVFLVGDGDSHHAGRATELAFTAFAGLDCVPLPAQRFLDYRVGWLTPQRAARTLVVGASASGGTERVAQCLTAAAERGALTLAVTGAADRPVARAAAQTLLVEPARAERCPGILTYQATLVGLLVTAIRLAGARGALDPAETDALLGELTAAADAVAATNEGLAGPCREAADRLTGAVVAGVLGSGPSEGTALFAAAKFVEGAGLAAYGQDLEEWSHVERFARPVDMPLFVIAPPGRSQARARDLVHRAAEAGRDVTVVARPSDAAELPPGVRLLPVRGTVREEFSPLVHHLFAARAASHLATSMGRLPFLGDLAR